MAASKRVISEFHPAYQLSLIMPPAIIHNVKLPSFIHDSPTIFDKKIGAELLSLITEKVEVNVSGVIGVDLAFFLPLWLLWLIYKRWLLSVGFDNYEG